MKFRKKPIIIEAKQFNGNYTEISDWIDGKQPPEANKIISQAPHPDLLAINTLEGSLYASKGDWIIRGVKGEYYPCKPDIFEATYEKVEE